MLRSLGASYSGRQRARLLRHLTSTGGQVDTFHIVPQMWRRDGGVFAVVADRGGWVSSRHSTFAAAEIALNNPPTCELGKMGLVS